MRLVLDLPFCTNETNELKTFLSTLTPKEPHLTGLNFWANGERAKIHSNHQLFALEVPAMLLIQCFKDDQVESACLLDSSSLILLKRQNCILRRTNDTIAEARSAAASRRLFRKAKGQCQGKLLVAEQLVAEETSPQFFIQFCQAAQAPRWPLAVNPQFFIVKNCIKHEHK
jgi:hypothetical protein